MFIGSTILSSCNLDELPDFNNTYLPNYEGSIALLLVNDTLSIREFLEENITDSSKYEISEDHQIKFSYEQRTDFTLGDKFVEVESFTNSQYIESPITVGLVLPRDTVLYFTQNVSFDFPSTKEGEELDSLYYVGGSFDFTVNTSFPGTLTYDFETPAFVDRVSLNSIGVNSSVTKSSSAPAVQKDTSISLNGYKTELISEGDSNKFSVTFDAAVYMSAGETLTGNEYVYFELGITDPEFDIVFGYFDRDTFAVAEKSIPLDFFDDLGGEGIEFESPELTFEIVNSFGIPMSLDFSQVHSQYADQEDLYFAGSFPNEPQLVFAPSIDNHGDSIETIMVINETNSNLRDLLSGSPDRLVMQLSGYSNYESDGRNFLMSGAKIDITAKVSMPLSVKIDGFEQVTEFELADMESIRGTKELSMILNAVNELPFDGSIDIIFLDENDVPMDSLVNQGLFVAPSVYQDGRVLEPAVSQSEIILSESLVDTMISASTLKLVTRLNSYGASSGDFIEIFADYNLIVKVGIAGNLSVDLNGN